MDYRTRCSVARLSVVMLLASAATSRLEGQFGVTVSRCCGEAPNDSLRERLRTRLTVVFVPMLNPDGAEDFQRENAVGIDVNRDARRLSTPEGQALRKVHESFKPDYGFNLHDQNAGTRVGRQGVQSAIALLAPAYDSLAPVLVDIAINYDDAVEKELNESYEALDRLLPTVR